MKHFSSEEWVDFVNQTTTQERAEVMRGHLSTGCKSCRQLEALWRRVKTFASTEPAYQPTEATVRAATVLLPTAGAVSDDQAHGGIIELLFDSFLQPALAGVRNACTGVRQMLYRAETLQIDLQIDSRPSSGRIVVTGQVLDVTRPEMIRSGLQVTLSNRRGNVVHAVTNEFGEFHSEIQNSGDLELLLRGESQTPIAIYLKDPLAEFPGGAQ